jgi:hypothetical protein
MRNFGSLMDSVLARHKIGAQVLAAQVVRSANEKLAGLVTADALRDTKVLSMKEGLITIACRHPAAKYEAEAVAPKLCRALEESFPSLSLRCEAKLRPEAFEEL